jgi:hypothetical protein
VCFSFSLMALMHCKISTGEWRDKFRYTSSSDIFKESACTYKTQPDSTFQGPFCKSHCVNNGNWKGGPGFSSSPILSLSVAFEPDYPDTPVVWATREDNRRGASGGWTGVAGSLKQISHAYAIKTYGEKVYGVNHDDDIYQKYGPIWDRIDGYLDHISVGCNPYFINQCEVWGVNDKSKVFYSPNPKTTKWTEISGTLEKVSVAYGKVGNAMTSVIWGVNKSGAAYYRIGAGGNWLPVSSTPKLVQVAVAYDKSGINFLVYGVTAGNDVYYRSSLNGGWTRADNISLKQVSVAFDPHGTPMVWGITVDGGSSYRWHVDSSSSLEIAGTAVQRREIVLTAQKNSNHPVPLNVSLILLCCFVCHCAISLLYHA